MIIDAQTFLNRFQNLLEAVDEIRVNQGERREFLTRAGQIINAKINIIPAPPPPDPEMIIYLTLRRLEYNRLFIGNDPNNDPRGNLQTWQLAIAVQDYDRESRRRTVEGSPLDAAIFRIKIKMSEAEEMGQFLRDNPAFGDLIQDTLRMSLDEFRDFLNNSDDWSIPLGEGEEPV